MRNDDTNLRSTKTTNIFQGLKLSGSGLTGLWHVGRHAGKVLLTLAEAEDEWRVESRLADH